VSVQKSQFVKRDVRDYVFHQLERRQSDGRDVEVRNWACLESTSRSGVLERLARDIHGE